MTEFTDAQRAAACSLYNAIVGEQTCLGTLLGDPDFDDPNTFGVRVKAGEFRKLVATMLVEYEKEIHVEPEPPPKCRWCGELIDIASSGYCSARQILARCDPATKDEA
jgi:hypothetical protein